MQLDEESEAGKDENNEDDMQELSSTILDNEYWDDVKGGKKKALSSIRDPASNFEMTPAAIGHMNEGNFIEAINQFKP